MSDANDDAYDVVAASVVVGLPAGPRLAVLGSTSFWGADSESLCRTIAGRLAQRKDLILITGGMTGVGEAFAQAAVECRAALGLAEHVYQVLPLGIPPCKQGTTLHAGADFHERRELLGRVANIYLVIEGGPGTEHEASVAAARGTPIIAAARTGGHAAKLYPHLTCPPLADSNDWALLHEQQAGMDAVAAAVDRIVWACCS